MNLCFWMKIVILTSVQLVHHLHQIHTQKDRKEKNRQYWNSTLDYFTTRLLTRLILWYNVFNDKVKVTCLVYGYSETEVCTFTDLQNPQMIISVCLRSAGFSSQRVNVQISSLKTSLYSHLDKKLWSYCLFPQTDGVFRLLCVWCPFILKHNNINDTSLT